jgi:hypothetical protein
MSDIGKTARVMSVWEVVVEAGQATPIEIHQRVSSRLGVPFDDPNFKRNIYRDLKQLADQGRLKVKYFSPSGEEIVPDDAENLKNTRIEYCAGEWKVDQISGHRILEDSSFQFVKPTALSMDWRVRLLQKTTDLDGSISLIVRGPSGKTFAFQLPADEIPAKIVVGRKTEKELEQHLLGDDLQEAFGRRTCALFSPDASVSRALRGTRLGHALLSVTSQRELSIQDLGSSSGTHWNSLRQEQLDEFVAQLVTERTISDVVDPFADSMAWNLVPPNGTNVKGPAIVKMGSLKIVVVL